MGWWERRRAAKKRRQQLVEEVLRSLIMIPRIIQPIRVEHNQPAPELNTVELNRAVSDLRVLIEMAATVLEQHLPDQAIPEERLAALKQQGQRFYRPGQGRASG